MNASGWTILFIAVFLALVSLVSGILTIHSYLEAHRHPKIKQPPTTVSIIVIVSIFILSGILTPIAFAVGRASTPEPSPTANNPTTTPTVIGTSPTASPQPTTPTPSFLYQADFSQGSQRWLDGNHSQQWTYNNTDKVLESDGSLPCCTPTTELENIVLNAPTTFTTANYTIEARMKAMGSNPYDTSQPPFFGFFFRGYGLNGNGYMAGILGSKPNANTGPFSFLLVQEPNQLLTKDDEAGYDLDNQWHTYRLVAQGNTYTFFIDQHQLYTQSLPQYFSPGPKIGIEDYDYNLQIQSFTVFPLQTTS